MNRNKVKVEIFVPLDSCVCTYASLIKKVGEVTLKFKDLIDLQTKSTKSPEAAEYGIYGMCVVIGGKMKLSSEFDKTELEEAIRKECKI